MAITYLTRQEIDAHRWDGCISAARNGVIYGYSWYLDAMATDWAGLVLDDYEAVMPLPFRRKWGVHYIYQPFLTAQLGVFGNNLSPQIVEAFFSAIPQRFRFWDFPLNHGNVFTLASYPVYGRQNFVLPLQRCYEELHNGYRENIRRNIKKAIGYGCVVATDVGVEEVIRLTKEQAKEATENDFEAFRKLFHFLKGRGGAKTYGVALNNDTLASCVFFFAGQRSYYILVGNHPNGRTLGASHMLIDAFIKDHAGQDLVLDFEGSDVQSLAFFYSSFGAKEEAYTAIRLNRLPRWMKWVKR